MTALLVATPGGHLTQLIQLLPRLPVDPQATTWVTVDRPQSRSLLAHHDVVWVPYSQPRDLVGAAQHARVARRMLRSRRFDIAVSTGASHAVPFLGMAARRGVPSHFIDSATRVTGPSTTGRLLAKVPGVHLYSQYRTWAAKPWRYGGSVLDGYVPVPLGSGGADKVSRVVVTLGSAEGFGFRSLVERLVAILPRHVEVLWQTGATDCEGLGIEPVVSIGSHELASAMREADVVVAHAGTGSALTALEAGRLPVLVPRRAARGEHIDDHQQEIAQELSGRGLAVVAEVGELSLDHLASARRQGVVPADHLLPFGLAG